VKRLGSEGVDGREGGGGSNCDNDSRGNQSAKLFKFGMPELESRLLAMTSWWPAAAVAACSSRLCRPRQQ